MDQECQRQRAAKAQSTRPAVVELREIASFNLHRRESRRRRRPLPGKLRCGAERSTSAQELGRPQPEPSTPRQALAPRSTSGIPPRAKEAESILCGRVGTYKFLGYQRKLTTSSIRANLSFVSCSPTATVDGRGKHRCLGIEATAQRCSQLSSPAKAVPVLGLRRTPRLFRKGPSGPFRLFCSLLGLLCRSTWRQSHPGLAQHRGKRLTSAPTRVRNVVLLGVSRLNKDF